MNREKIVIAASIGLLLLSQPYLYLLSYGNYNALIFVQCLISIPAGAYYATVPVMQTEMFPLNLRCTVLSVLYLTAASLSAGLMPLLSLMILRGTNSAVTPTLLVIALVVFSLVTMGVKYLRDGRFKICDSEYQSISQTLYIEPNKHS